MPTALGLLLRSSLLRRKQEDKDRRPGRPARLGYKDSKTLARKVEEPHARLRLSGRLHPQVMSTPFGL